MKNLRQKLLAELNRFEQSVRDHAFLGAKAPEDHPEIQLQYNRAKERLVKLIEESTK